MFPVREETSEGLALIAALFEFSGAWIKIRALLQMPYAVRNQTCLALKTLCRKGVAALRLTTISQFPGGLRPRLTSSRRVAASLTGYSSCSFH